MASLWQNETVLVRIPDDISRHRLKTWDDGKTGGPGHSLCVLLLGDAKGGIESGSSQFVEKLK